MWNSIGIIPQLNRPAHLVVIVSVTMSMTAAFPFATVLAFFLTPFVALFTKLLRVCPVARCVFALIPIISNEIDLPPARVIFAAMLVPICGVSNGYSKIERRQDNIYRRRRDQYRLGKHQLRHHVAAEIDLAIKTGLPDIDRYADIHSKCTEGRSGEHGRETDIFHNAPYTRYAMCDGCYAKYVRLKVT